MKEITQFSIATLLFLVFTQFSFGQSLILNEISQGPSGAKEYVEFLVIPGSGSYHCTDYCVDIRNWIIDDNSGYFSGGNTNSTGVATGAVRFSNDVIWSCVPIGTLIVVYNNVDINSDIPSQDLSTTDGNCRIIIPVNSSLLEYQTVSPGGGLTSYPSSGWMPGGSLWGPLGMSNNDDSFQVYNSNNLNTPVHAVSWGNNNTNNIIYFSTSSVGNTVFYFGNTVDNNPSNQANWISGFCSAPDEQTPGAPNNAANAAYINSLTNSCAGPLVASINSTTDAGSCQCNGSSTVNATGSIPGYTYNWFNSSNVSIGQTNTTASNLCAGTYYCIVSSSINCIDTVFVTINSTTNTILPTFNSIPPICNGETFNLPSSSLNGITGIWSPSIDNTQTTNYTFTPDPNQCASPTTLTVIVSSIPQISINETPTICQGEIANLTTTVNLNGGSYLWSPNSETSSTLTVNPQSTTTYSVVYELNGCQSLPETTIVTVNPSTSPTFDQFGPFCEDAILAQVILPETSNNGIQGTWNPAMLSTDNPGMNSYTFTPISGQCANVFNMSVEVFAAPPIEAGVDVTICTGSSVQLSASGGIQYMWTDAVQNGQSFEPTASHVYYVIGTDANGCEATDSIKVFVLPNPLAAFTPDVSSGQAPLNVQFTNTSSNASNYFWYFGNGDSISSINMNSVNSTYNNPQIYTVWLIASNGICSDSTFALINVITLGEPEISIPNVLSPNNDNINDLWFISTKNMASIQILILNRWGNLVKQINTTNGSWDGKTDDGQDATDGVYFYNYTAKALNGEDLSGHGFITLIR